MNGLESPSAEPLRWRPRAYLLLGAGGVLLVAAVIDRNPVPLYLALPLLLAAPAAALAGPRGMPRLIARRTVEGSGPDVHVEGVVEAAGRIDPNDLFVETPCPPGLYEAAPPVFERTPNEVRFTLEWRAREPTTLVVPPPRVTWRDAVGLVERGATIDLPGLIVERYPPELLRISNVQFPRTTVRPGESRSRQIGPEGEFYGIRDAIPEDSPRRINWVASARAGRLVANEYRVDRTGDLVLLLDTRATPLGPVVDQRLLSISRAAAGGIAQSFLRGKTRVGLGIFGEFLAAIPLSTGRTQQHRIRTALLSARYYPGSAPSERCAISLGRYFPPGVTVVLFSSLADEEGADLLPYLRRRGFRAVALSPSPLPAILPSTRHPTVDEALVARLYRLLRREQIARAWQDAPTIDWEDYWSLAPFVQFLRRPAIRRWG